MVKYFEELEKPDSFKVYIMQNSIFHDANNPISIDFYIKYYKIFEYIKEINNSVILRMIRETYSIKDNSESYQRQSQIINLIKEKYVTQDKDIYEVSQELYCMFISGKYESILKLLKRVDSLTTQEMKSILYFYKYYVEIVYEYHDMLPLFNEAINEINKEKKIIYKPEYKAITLPNYWYILPKFHDLEERLYNTTGEHGHKEANLMYPYLKALDGYMIDYTEFLSKVKEIEKDGVSLRDYAFFVRYGMGYFPKILNDNSELYDVKSHIKNNILVTTGCVMAQGILWEFFWNLSRNTSNYQEALDNLKNFILDDFLIRFLGFHKVITRNDQKIISTSNLDYEEEFSEYKRNGWCIDFTKPLEFNYQNNKIEEINDDIVKIKQFHSDFF